MVPHAEGEGLILAPGGEEITPRLRVNQIQHIPGTDLHFEVGLWISGRRVLVLAYRGRNGSMLGVVS